MTWSSFGEFFDSVTGGLVPLRYQTRLAEGRALPPLIHLPTGVGKTLAIVLAWVWRRRFHPDEAVRRSTPRRLVYCLPVRNLVEQTRDVIKNLKELGIPVYTLMGGEVEEDWLLYPEAEAILVTTQDLGLSRALNRGYVMRRFRWPMAFGLLNSDALWVLDEVQLFGVGLDTSAQLQAFREKLGAFGPIQTVWMSATLQPDWVTTVDHPAPTEVFRLLPREAEELTDRLRAVKRLTRLEVGGVKEKGYGLQLARTVAEHHKPGTLTLVICNTVDRAVEVYKNLERLTGVDRLLLHSRFRPHERREQMDKLRAPLPSEGRIIVSTQVVEAGVDLDARTLVTELAPWSSLVQRFGRCNRMGRYSPADVLWVDVGDHPHPYGAADLVEAREHLLRLEGQSVSPAELPPVSPARPAVDLLRRRDLIDLFDTTPDLMGNDVDVSRFIRDGAEHDLYLFWRAWQEDAERDGQETPERDELCSVPVGRVREWLTKERLQAWVYDPLLERWRAATSRDLRPGAVLMLPAEARGYSPETGWDPGAWHRVEPVPLKRRQRPEGFGGDPDSVTDRPQTIQEHTAEVVAELEVLLAALPALTPFAHDLRLAAWYHDLGKAHEVFQATMRAGLPEDRSGLPVLWAKSARRNLRHRIPGFRHELASALAFLKLFAERFLSAYLIGAHHGRVRLAIRALPGEALDTDGRRVLGVTQGDPLPPVDLGGGHLYPGGSLDQSPMHLGGDRPSWTEQAVALRDRLDLGPFRLAFLEAILRAADQRASMRGTKEVSE